MTSLTAREIRSLRGLRSPLGSRDAVSQFQKACCPHALSRLWRDIRRLLHLLFSRNELVPLLEGKKITRWDRDPRVLIIVGEEESCCHLPGVSTVWRGCDHYEIQIACKSHFFSLIRGVLPTTLSSGCRNQSLPLPPSPFRMQRLMRSASRTSGPGP